METLIFLIGAVSGAFATLVILKSFSIFKNTDDEVLKHSKQRRNRLPLYIILVRHGESEGNADKTLYRTQPDNQVKLTARGQEQAEEAGKYIEEKIFQKIKGVHRVFMIVSPFERTLQTAAAMRRAFEHRIVRTELQPRIREQEFGNLQGEDFKRFREEQKVVGRFWYRYPTGESGADVFDRVKTFWNDTVLTINERVGYEHVDALVIVTHGLTMRFVLMQLFNWSPSTFHSVWNANNCDKYVLRKDLTKPGFSPYVLDGELGNMPRSSIDLQVKVKCDFTGEIVTRAVTLNNYLSIPPPRMTKLDIFKKMIVEQDDNDISNEDDIVGVDTTLFTDRLLKLGRSIINCEDSLYQSELRVVD